MKTEKYGFTTIELFIMVVILGILAAIVVPQFSEASSEARLSYLVKDLQKMRSQIALYKVQHDDLLPGQKERGGEITEADFVEALTIAGDDGLGPYIESIPRNPFNDQDSIRLEPDSSGRAGGSGWLFNTRTGEFYADNSDCHRCY